MLLIEPLSLWTKPSCCQGFLFGDMPAVAVVVVVFSGLSSSLDFVKMLHNLKQLHGLGESQSIHSHNWD